MTRPFVLLCLFILSSTAAAQDHRLESLTTGEAVRGWEAVGRLDLDGHGFCTAAMISDTELLTAAHCLFDQDGARIPLDRLQFAAGMRTGRAVAFRGVRRAAIYPDYRPEPTRDPVAAARDIALLELDRPIRLAGIAPFAEVAPLDSGSEVAVVSYAHDRAEAPALEAGCSVLEAFRGAMILSCSVDSGSSGAPVFVRENGTARIAGIVTAKAQVEARDVSIGVVLDDRLDTLRAELAGMAGPFSSDPGQVRILVPGQQSDEIGAKFVRP